MNNLKISDVSYEYKNLRALDNISFEVNDGLIGVLGANGAGKSTLMKLITTLYKLQGGSIELNGLSYDKNLKDIRNSLWYLPQNFEVYDNLTGEEFLQIVASLKKGIKGLERCKHIDEIVNTMNMKKFIGRKIKEYSGGMKQKLGFAQALIGYPKVIIMDEPTVGLDPEQRNIIRELFPRISRDRIVFVTTHIVEDIENYCNYLIVLKDGELIYKGSKESFIEEVMGLLWEVTLSGEEYVKNLDKLKIISTIIDGDCFRIMYISKKAEVENSQNIIPTLQDSYIIHSMKYENGWNI